MASYHRKEVRKKDIKELFPNFTPEYPLHLQQDLFDIAILGTPREKKSIEQLKILFSKFVTYSNGVTIDAVTIEWNAAIAPLDFRVQEILKRATHYFFYISDDFYECSISSYLKSEAIEKALKEGRSCIIPVFPGNQKDVPGLRGTKGISLQDLLKGKSLEDVDVGSLTAQDISESLLTYICKPVRENSFVKLNRQRDLEMERELFKEEEKLRILRETRSKITSRNSHHLGQFESKDMRPADHGHYKLSLGSGLTVIINMSDIKCRPITADTGEPIDYTKPGPRDISNQRADILRSTWPTECDRSRQGRQEPNEVHLVPVNGGRQKVYLTLEFVKVRTNQPTKAGRSRNATPPTANSRHC